MAQTYFATINPGLEEALLAEVRGLGGKRAKVLNGGVEFDATNTVFYRCAYRLRCANRLWLRMDEFRSRDAPELFNKTRRIDWARLLPPDAPIEVRAVSHGSRLYHTGKVEETVRQAIDESLGRDPLREGVPLHVLARVVDDRCQLSLDASGELLFRRGWKVAVGEAPIRESIAAAVLRLVEWDPHTSLVDPFCGSGTFVVEAAARVGGLAAGRDRDFAFHRWKNFRPKLWKDVTNETAEGPPKKLPELVGFDLSPAAVEAARHNAERAAVESVCRFEVRDVGQLEPVGERPGFIVTNPPWDVRIEDPGQAAIPTLVRRFRQEFDGWKLAVVSPTRLMPDEARVVTRFDHGSIEVCLWMMQ
jgi:putative N6-adenine-specific DNA methylase